MKENVILIFKYLKWWVRGGGGGEFGDWLLHTVDWHRGFDVY
jgi:hypothetical protein